MFSGNQNQGGSNLNLIPVAGKKGKKRGGKKNKNKNKNRVFRNTGAVPGHVKPIDTVVNQRVNIHQSAGNRVEILDRQMPVQTNKPIMTPGKMQKPFNPLSPEPKPKLLFHQERIPKNFTFVALPKSVLMSVGTTIYLDLFSQSIYYPDKLDYDKKLLSRPDLWHQIVVHHNGKFRKKEILHSLFALIRTQEIFPIGYREYDLWDTFLLTASDRVGLEVLFSNNLRLRIRDTDICVSVQLGAGQIVMGQVHPKAQIILVCQELLETANNQCLNMEGFERHSSLAEVCISFANTFHLTTIVKSLIEHDQLLGRIKGIRFANCGIERLDPLRFLSNFTNLEYIDLRSNRIESIFQLKHLEKLNLMALDIAGNPFTEKEELYHLQERIKKMLPTLEHLDGEKLIIRVKVEPDYLATGEDLEFDIMLDGDPITINDDLLSIHATFKQRYKMSNYWHKVRVYHNGQYNRKQIISKLLALVENNDLWPCYYSSLSQFDEFYVHNNLEALDILVRNKLYIKSTGNELPLQLMLNMNVAPFKVGQVDVSEKIQRICLDGFDNKVLYLNSLADREIFKNVIIDMSSPRVVSQILLWASRKVGQVCTMIHLNNNGIVSCKGMAALHWFAKLEGLNLRNNCIESFERLGGIPQPNKITSVQLEGNPLCNASLQQYIKNVKHYFPEVKTLDGAPVNGEILMLGRQNYLCKPEAYTFVESFIKHYFSIYDSNQKHLLKEMYMDQAMFTLSTNFDANRSKDISRITKYTSKSRNIIRLTNLDQVTRNVFIGPDEILKTLIELHVTEHNLMSFCIDVPIYTKTFVVITINGVFKDKAMQFLDDEFILHFTRSFTIRSCASGMGVSGLAHQFKIQNDSLLVRNVSTMEKLSAIEDVPMKDEDVNGELGEHEMENLVVVFQEMTQLNKQWCNRFLQEAKWNFKLALNLCVKLLEDDEIPEDAFIKY